MTLPEISLVTICRNAGATIARTFDSVLAQSLPPKEYFVVDDDSTDGTEAILEEYATRFAAREVHFRVQRQNSHHGEAGIPHAWNQAIAQCRGEIVALLNADDCYEPEALKTVAETFREHPGCEAVACQVAFVAMDGKTLRTLKPRSMKLLPWLMPVPHPGCFFRNAVYQRLGTYDTRYRISADYDFIWRCCINGVRFHYKVMTVVRMLEGGAAGLNRATAQRETYAIARRYCRWWDLRPWMAYCLRFLV